MSNFESSSSSKMWDDISARLLDDFHAKYWKMSRGKDEYNIFVDDSLVFVFMLVVLKQKILF
jgi:hypothetical protein